MPTLLRVRGYRFFFFSLEGREPPHMHVAHGGRYAKFWLLGNWATNWVLSLPTRRADA
ncbi:MAG: DUF4160 domain-containing protein [Acidobacteria bacterium]|nr:DUF4160 domain-containing protein [Acidobacteriota bacterium]